MNKKAAETSPGVSVSVREKMETLNIGTYKFCIRVPFWEPKYKQSMAGRILTDL